MAHVSFILSSSVRTTETPHGEHQRLTYIYISYVSIITVHPDPE